MNIFLVRYSEIGLKGQKTRKDMETRLVRNIKISHKMMGLEVDVKAERGRIFAYSNDRNSSIKCLSRVMGIKSFSEVNLVESGSMDRIVDAVKTMFLDKVRGKTFAVSTRRTGNHSFTSIELSRAVADSIYMESRGVDLSNPEIQINIEVRGNSAYVIRDRIDGPGGLPLGSEAKLTALVSGGIDSPVAVWMMLKRGSPVDMIFVSLAYPLDARQFLRNAKSLYDNWYFGYDPIIYIVDAGRLVDQYLSKGKMKFSNVSFKKIMYNIGEKLAKETGCYGIITGESSGQVSSQTPENLMQLSRMMEIPVHRPLIGLDKDEIIQISRKIGTFSNDDFGEFCSLFGEVPITHIKREELQQDMDNLYDYFPSRGEIHKLRGSQIDSLLNTSDQNYEKDVIEDGDTVIDLRDRLSYKQWHHPGSINVQMDQVFEKVREMENKGSIILYCQKGLQSAHVAARLREMGYSAFYTKIDRIRNQTQ